MKKRTVKLLSLMMVTTFLATSTITTEAAGTGAYQKIKTGDKISKKESANKGDYVEGQALVLYKDNKISTKAAAQRVLNVSDISVSKVWNFDAAEESKGRASTQSAASAQSSATTTSLTVGLVTSKTLSTKKLIEKLSADSDVQIAEPNYRVHALTNDSYFSKQWGLKNTGQNGGVEGNATNVEKKWEKTKGSDDVVVAVVDTGVDYTHEDLKDNMWENTYQPKLRGEYGYDFANADTDPMDDEGHGTHCAGIIGAKGDNGVGVSGMNHNVKIMALKALDERGSGSDSDLIDAYNYINKAINLGVNVAAINDSWGGEGKSAIFKKLMDLVGAKGAVSVCAAGNESADNDETAIYPANDDCAYKISVAATNEKGELSNYSNYGSEKVDIAAPGSDILSTYAEDCYNPSIYSAEKQKEVTQKFENFNGESTWADWSPENIQITSTLNEKESGYKAELSDDNLGETKGKSLKISLKGVSAGETVSVRIPYTVSEGTKEFPEFSAMTKVSGPKSTASMISSGSVLIIGECAADRDLPESTDDLIDENWDIAYNYNGYEISGEMEDWVHLEVPQEEKNPKTGERSIFLSLMAEAKGDYTITLDDLGLSKENVASSNFGKYEYESGTSMATPFVTGAVALEAAENPKSTALERISAVLSQVKRTDVLEGKVATGGALDYTQKVANAPRISTVKVNQSNGQITINGSGLDATDLSVNVTEKGSTTAKAAKIVKKTEKQVVIDGKAWLNRVASIAVTGNGRTATKKNIYLVDGKSSYKKVKGLEVESSSNMATDGRNIYMADSSSDNINILDQSDPEEVDEYPLTVVKPTKYFKKEAGSQGRYDFAFGNDLVYADGMLYNIGAYSEVQGSTDEDIDEGDDDDDDDDTTESAYSSEYKLFAFNTSNGKVQCIGTLPSAVMKTEDWTLAAYNGRIYLIGGYDYQQKACSKKVYIYNPGTKKWSQGPSLPEGRAGGKALQSGGKLVYTLGYGEKQDGVEYEKQTCPVNLILSGNKWTASKKTLSTYGAVTKVVNGSKAFKKYDVSVNICAGGLVYVGNPMVGLGDTFTYNVAKDTYNSTKYNQITNLDVYDEDYDYDYDDDEDEECIDYDAITVGSTLYIFDEDGQGYKATIGSGLVKVTAKASKAGKISGANRGILPGNKVRLTAKANKGYALKSFKVAGKKVSGTSKTIRLTGNTTASASFGKAVSKLTLKDKELTLKAGKKAKIQVKVTPKSAVNKKLSYTSSNKRYATVSSKGVVHALKAGKGKTVKITVKATDGSGKKVVCKVKIQ